MSTDDIIDGILKHEGGYVDHPDDRGGPTNHGITMATLTAWRRQPVTADDVRALTEAEARTIYQTQYIVAPGFEPLPEPLRAVVVDWGVLSGPGIAARGLQKALGVFPDGVVGDKTLAAAMSLPPMRAAILVCAEQARQIGRIISNNHSQAVFAAGWLNRLADKLVSVLGDVP